MMPESREEFESRLTAAKMVLALAGIATFGAGIRWDVQGARWTGLAIVAAAWFLRYARRFAPAEDSGGADEGSATERS